MTSTSLGKHYSTPVAKRLHKLIKVFNEAGHNIDAYLYTLHQDKWTYRQISQQLSYVGFNLHHTNVRRRILKVEKKLKEGEIHV